MVQIMTRHFTRMLAAAAKANIPAGPFTGPLSGSYLGLYTAIAPSASVDSVAADITEADFPGYARKAITWAGVTDSSDGFAELLGGLNTWTPTDDSAPNTIIGVALYDALTAGNLLGIDLLNPVVPLPSEFSSLNYVPAFGLFFAQPYNVGDVIP